MRRFAMIATCLTAFSAAAAATTAAAPPTTTTTKPAAPATTRPATTRPAATRPAPPSEAEIRAAFDRGDYKAALEHITRALGYRGAAAPAYDRYALTLLRAECHLRLRQTRSAADAFTVAAKLTTDEEQAAAARAMSRLVTEAKGGPVRQRHAAKGTRPAEADLLDMAQRDEALRIFRDDLRADAEPKVKAALGATTIPPIAEALDALYYKLDFERVTDDGTYDRDVSVRNKLSERARTLIAGELDRMEGLVDEIWANANTIAYAGPSVRSDPNSPSRTVYRGLSVTDKSDLKAVMSTTGRIPPTVAGLGRATGAVPARDGSLVKRARDLRRFAEAVLRHRYTE